MNNIEYDDDDDVELEALLAGGQGHDGRDTLGHIYATIFVLVVAGLFAIAMWLIEVLA